MPGSQKEHCAEQSENKPIRNHAPHRLEPKMKTFPTSLRIKHPRCHSALQVGCDIRPQHKLLRCLCMCPCPALSPRGIFAAPGHPCSPPCATHVPSSSRGVFAALQAFLFSGMSRENKNCAWRGVRAIPRPRPPGPAGSGPQPNPPAQAVQVQGSLILIPWQRRRDEDAADLAF